LTKIVGVQFRGAGKAYYFSPGELSIPKGTGVIVETARGAEYGVCILPELEVDDDKIVQPLRRVIRIATKQDMAILESNAAKEQHAMGICRQKVEKHDLKMKLIRTEYAFDGNKIMFFFTADGRVDFRQLVKDLAAEFHTRIELRQVGVRDESRMLGGVGICGKPFCCSSFLNEFSPVSIKMAKEQGLSLNPVKISGTCGRLMCCLSYEQETYEELQATMPYVDSVVETPAGRGIVTDVNLLRGQVKVLLTNQPDLPPKFFDKGEIKVLKKARCCENKCDSGCESKGKVTEENAEVL
jgi:cell fate regulator YaaT (PSP1 superfamily)